MAKHTLGANMQLAGVGEHTQFGVKGVARTPGAADLFPPDWIESITKEQIYLELGQIGLVGERITPVIVGENVNGSLSGLLYFDSDPIWTAIAIVIGEETVTDAGDPYTHTFRFGENYYNGSNAVGGTLARHMSLELEAADTGYFIQSFKGSSVEFTLSRDEGVRAVIAGTAYKCTRGAVDSSLWTGREAVADLVLLSNTCSFSMRMDEYSASQTLTAGDEIRPSNIRVMLDQANDVAPDAGTGIGVAEPIMTPSARKLTLEWVQDFGNDDPDYGRRDWTQAYEDGTALQCMLTISTDTDEEILMRFSKLLLDGPGKPILDGPDVIAMTYTATGYIPNESQTNDFLGLDAHCFDLDLINDRPGLYMMSELES